MADEGCPSPEHRYSWSLPSSSMCSISSSYVEEFCSSVWAGLSLVGEGNMVYYSKMPFGCMKWYAGHCNGKISCL